MSTFVPGTPLLAASAPRQHVSVARQVELPPAGFSGPPMLAAPTGQDNGAPTHELPPAGWTPARPPIRKQVDPQLIDGPRRSAPSDQLPTNREHVVLRGECLWSIAAAALGGHPSAAQIAQEWPRWYAANRDVIGNDPDLLQPGQRLRAPAAAKPLDAGSVR